MDDFFSLIYDHAALTGALNLDRDPGYRLAHSRLTQLIEPLRLDADAENDLMNAVYDLNYHAELAWFSYGFRLAVQVIRPVDL